LVTVSVTASSSVSTGFCEKTGFETRKKKKPKNNRYLFDFMI